jgi:uncharacterized membrane protein
MDLYEFLKTLHVIGAAAWVGGGAISLFQAARVRASGDQGRMIDFLDEAEWLGKKYFAPLAGVTALMGVLMVLKVGAENFKEPWIVIGIVGFLLSSFIGARYLTPESARLRELVSQKGLDDPESKSRIQRITMVTRLDTLILVLVIADMVIKPGT